jgi:hypothetical protein
MIRRSVRVLHVTYSCVVHSVSVDIWATGILHRSVRVLHVMCSCVVHSVSSTDVPICFLNTERGKEGFRPLSTTNPQSGLIVNSFLNYTYSETSLKLHP